MPFGVHQKHTVLLSKPSSVILQDMYFDSEYDRIIGKDSYGCKLKFDFLIREWAKVKVLQKKVGAEHFIVQVEHQPFRNMVANFQYAEKTVRFSYLFACRVTNAVM